MCRRRMIIFCPECNCEFVIEYKPELVEKYLEDVRRIMEDEDK